MAIRFQCSSCAQPIEVDDEWALKAVTCPYCRKTVTAPRESVLGDPARIPTASPVAPVGSPLDVSTPHEDQIAPSAAPTNRIATAAMVLAVCSFALLVAYAIVLSRHAEEVARLNEGILNARSFAERTEVYSEFLREQGHMPAWMVAISAFAMMGGACWVAAIVCGVIGLRRAVRRQIAVYALLLTGVIPLLFCCGGSGVAGG